MLLYRLPWGKRGFPWGSPSSSRMHSEVEGVWHCIPDGLSRMAHLEVLPFQSLCRLVAPGLAAGKKTWFDDEKIVSWKPKLETIDSRWVLLWCLSGHEHMKCQVKIQNYKGIWFILPYYYMRSGTFCPFLMLARPRTEFPWTPWFSVFFLFSVFFSCLLLTSSNASTSWSGSNVWESLSSKLHKYFIKFLPAGQKLICKSCWTS